MAKGKGWICSGCGHRLPKWMGQCPRCQRWNVVERVEEGGREVEGDPESHRPGVVVPQTLHDLTGEEQRLSSGFSQLDSVLGGGIVPGSVVLLSGEPGIGKSTLLLQVAARASAAGKVLYLSGEESLHQIKSRAERTESLTREVLFVNHENVRVVPGLVSEHTPLLVIVDSIQTVSDPDLSSAAGSVNQVQAAARVLTTLAKGTGTAVFLVGHVTKSGRIAGPKALEHMVDTVLYLEGQKHYQHRMLRVRKNRFGPTDEFGLFEMTAEGLTGVDNPSRLFLAERPRGAPGSVVIPSLEGTQPLLVELQALVSHTGYGNPYRLTNGVESKRLALILAVLEKRAGYQLLGEDVYINVAGGVRLDEPAVDLGLALAVASSFSNRILPGDAVVAGEVGLAGEVRSVKSMRVRLREAEKLGFSRAYIPAGNEEGLDFEGLEVIPLSSITEAIERVLGGE